MSAPIDYTWKMEDERSRRNDAGHVARINAVRARLAAELAPRAQPGPDVNSGLTFAWVWQSLTDTLATLNVETSLPATLRAAGHPTVHDGVVLHDPVEDEPIFVRIDWKLKLKERLWPRLRRERLARETSLAHAIPDEVEYHIEELVASSPLPGAGL